MYCVGKNTLVVTLSNPKNKHNVINMINMVPGVTKVIFKNPQYFIDPALIDPATIYVEYNNTDAMEQYLTHPKIATICVRKTLSILNYYILSRSFYLDLTPLTHLDKKYYNRAIEYIKHQRPIIILFPNKLLDNNRLLMYIMNNATIREIRLTEGKLNSAHLFDYSHSVLNTNIKSAGVSRALARNLRRYRARLRYIYMTLRFKKVPKYIAISIISAGLDYYKLHVVNNTVLYKKVFH